MDGWCQYRYAEKIYFEEHKGSVSDLIRYSEITGYIVFDVKLIEKFIQKDRSCMYGHNVEYPLVMMYKTIVYRDPL